MLSVKALASKIFIPVLRIGLLGILFAPPAYSAAGDDACTNVSPLELNRSLRTYGDVDADFFDVDVPARGLLVIQVVAPLDVPAPKVALVGDDCRPGGAAAEGWRILETFATGFVLEVREPGAFRFGVAAEDPRLRLGRYKVTTGFVSDPDIAAVPDDQSTGALETMDIESTEDPDPEPDPVDPPSTEDPDPEPDPVDNKVTGKKRLCRPSSMDDHGDVFPCASTLFPGASSDGRLANAWNDDRDVFTFVLTEWRTVEIEATGDADTLGALYDAHGHRLSVDGADLDVGFRIVATLAPGRYFIGVEGSNGATGRYVLSLDTVTWPSPD